MPRYRTTSREERSTRQQREQEERFRQEMRELMLREIHSAMNLALRDLQQDIAQSMRQADTLQSEQMIFRSGLTGTMAGDSRSSASPANGNWAGFLSTAVLRLFSARQTTRTSQSDAIESTRSSQENQFYRESRSQREASLSQLSGGGARNL